MVCMLIQIKTMERRLPEVVSYPHYCPDIRSLRSYLLVYDRLSTIVPSCDQDGVRQRKGWAEISSVAGPDVLGFFDPAYQYSNWFNHPASKREFCLLYTSPSPRD